MIIGQDVRRIRFVCFGGGGASGAGDESMNVQNDYTGAWSQEDKEQTAGLISSINEQGIVTDEQSFTNEVNKEQAAQKETHKDIFSVINTLSTMMNPTLGLVTKGLETVTTPTTLSAVQSLTPGVTGSGKIAGGGGLGGGEGKALWEASKPVSAQQGIAVNTAPVSQKELQTKQNEAQANPEEAAAMAEQEEKKKARQRVGLLQMRAVDPLFIEGLPDIFRSRAV